MNKKNIALIFVIALLALVGYKLFFSDSKKSEESKPISKTTYLMGTIINLNIFENASDDIFEKSFDIVKRIENKMSPNIENSEISTINKNAGISSTNVSQETFNVIEKSINYSNLSKGYFDISTGPLVNLWVIGTEKARVPSEDEIKQLLDKVGYKNIALDKNNSSVTLSKQGMMLDLGGIAKGYTADEIAKYLKSQNINKAIIDLGGNIYALGSKSNSEPWKIGVQNPFVDARGTHIGILSVRNKSVVTSGVYERFLEANKKRYHHILNPFTGYPIDNNLMSVTIVSDKSIDGDALSTSVFSLGLEEGLKLVKSQKNVEAIFVTNNKEVYITPGLKNNFELTDKNFKLKN
ncbi:thiamine biosynthesis lipoprotein ApbE [Gottschalkia purinilytica]|uniref:FAD:protein FMN transferase n=1 Tax=Gottschalkia purinilytica TaxID=1503 RepID=A0A0L0WCM1_GOTPU|nr:FAD:protein FMN transferase [Gottschalkia purinilytica]KNF09213.1 thiamine biosynthesis lipoprotein ApbE [Gottschalkia purinilytica]